MCYRPCMTDHKTFSKTLPRKITAAGALCTNAEGKVLLVVPTYKTEWEIPGGTVEENESPKQACKREVLEELGIDIPIGNLLRLNYREETERVAELLLFLFDGGVLDAQQIAAIKLPQDELSHFHFVTLDEAKDKVIPSLHQLIESGLAQRELNQTDYTEYSRPV